jgi:hypothetical protein
MNYTFDASQYTPEQSAGAHPIGKFPAAITGTEIRPTYKNDGGMFCVEFSTEAGRITMRYNLWNQNQKAVDIAHKQLSALSHATGVFRINMQDEGAALRGARCIIEVAKQAEGEYIEVKRVFDANGNEPGRAPIPAPTTAPFPPQAAPQAAPQPIAAPPQPAQPAWGAQPTAASTAGPNTAPAWGGTPTQPAPQPPQAAAPPAWSQQAAQGNAAAPPPWAK